MSVRRRSAEGRPRQLFATAAALVWAALAAATAACGDATESESGGRIPVAVVGDSDIHGYHDDVRGVIRGGAYSATTFQWTEILARRRGDDLDFGPAGRWGQRGVVARARDRLGLTARTPPKNDFRYNFAISGARCSTLLRDWPWQGRWLLSLLESDRERWAEGLVVVKIGVNDLGQQRHMEAFADGGSAAEAIERCADEIARLVNAIRAVSTVKVLVVGVADDSSWPAASVPSWTLEQIARIRAELDAFDSAVRDAVAGVAGTAFMDDRAWYYDRWPDRDEDGNARTGGVSLGGAVEVTNTQGDEPIHLMLEDGHAGTVGNGFWANEFLRTVNREFGFGVAPLLPGEIADVADPSGEWGIAGVPPALDAAPQVELSSLPPRIAFDALPYSLPGVSARDAAGTDVSATLVARLESADGRILPLFGSGRTLEIRPSRHGPGEYLLVVEARDRLGNVGRWTGALRIDP